MKIRSIWMFLRTVSGIGLVCWCVDRIRCNVIHIDWMRASWPESGGGPVTFEARWKYRWSKTWTEVHTDVDLNPNGPTELPLTPKHTIAANTAG